MHGLNKYLDDNAFEASPAEKPRFCEPVCKLIWQIKIPLRVGGDLVDFKNDWTSVLKSL